VFYTKLSYVLPGEEPVRFQTCGSSIVWI